jgi:glutamate/tyrosine decarboxylase-like PLP-dependent enzyme
MTRTSLPAKGTEKQAVLDRLRDMRSRDIPLEFAKFNLLTPYADDSFFDVGLQALNMFAHENAMFARLIPSVATVIKDILDIAMSLQNAPEEAGAVITAGGTESLFSACWAARDYWREQNPSSTAIPEVVGPNTMHAAFQKAAHLLGMKLVMTEFDENFRGRPEDIEAHINENTAMIVGSAPAYPHGVFDPIEELSKIALRHQVWLHVDACVGGYVSPFAEKLGIEIPPYDFRLPGVRSLSADVHKHGYAPKGISTLIYRDAALLKYQSFTTEGWPYGIYKSGGFAGSRPTHVMAAAWAIFNHLGEEGYLDLVRGIYRAKTRLIEGITSIPDMYVLGTPESSVFTFTSDSYDVHAVAELMEERGWYCFRIQAPRGLHIQCDPFDDGTIDKVIASMRACVDRVRTNKLQSGSDKTGYR